MGRKKVFIITSILSLIASFTLIGSGFALWEFNESSSSSQFSLSLNVENYLEFGEVEIIHCPNYFYIESNNTQYSNYGGIVFYYKADDAVLDEQTDSTFNFKITPKEGYSGENYSIDDFKASLSFKIESPLSKYFELNEESESLNKTTYDSFDEFNKEFIFKFEEEGNNTFSLTDDSTLYLNRCFEYKSQYEPITTTEYKEMVNEIKGYVNKSDQALLKLTLTITPTDNSSFH